MEEDVMPSAILTIYNSNGLRTPKLRPSSAAFKVASDRWRRSSNAVEATFSTWVERARGAQGAFGQFTDEQP